MTDHPPTRPVLIAAFALVVGALASASPAWSQSAVSEGQKLAFDRSKGNCLTCHVIKGGDLPGTIGPELKDIKIMSTAEGRDVTPRTTGPLDTMQPK